MEPRIRRIQRFCQFLIVSKGGAANGSLQNLSSSECSKVYAADLQSSYRNFLAITNYSSNLSPIIAIFADISAHRKSKLLVMYE